MIYQTLVYVKVTERRERRGWRERLAAGEFPTARTRVSKNERVRWLR
jgi:hypothetical protein